MTSPMGLVAMHLQIEEAMKKIMKDGKMDKHDIPELVLLFTNLALTAQTSNASVKLTNEDIIEKMNGMYDYIMTQYKLYPAEETEKANYKQLFDISMQLVLFQPNIKKQCKSCFNCLA